ncbi:CAP domain-containing protein [Cereibacter sphaeroides]|uniref:CAP domain-containing protein n=1 Tax=Rhodobacterales TaxID=204455 RepID=UPI000BBF2B35|nr:MULTISPECIES: CAP domain-containing protein [Paracoccaceae]MCE6952255.1 CAP domain-containing protein [Cereibacter sphaeroides]MCE6961050.1 CAP domain-containing protein [Cereibacter sphaeroides]MCE6969652.1 CAP domain-containing protein [Cereibacter sphaeroides]MCE6975127.1 CAP domain-containing protein [Cereibacter sphaeroides]
MKTLSALALCGVMALSACASKTSVALGPDGKPMPQVYRIAPGQESEITYRLLDSVNTLRQAKGAAPLQLNSELTAAAATHARDMSVQNRPWHFGSDGSSPLVRVQRAGYQGKLLGELISETYQTELETLAAWMEQRDTRDVVLDPSATDLGFAWYQESQGKIWWTVVTGSSMAAAQPVPVASMAVAGL